VHPVKCRHAPRLRFIHENATIRSFALAHADQGLAANKSMHSVGLGMQQALILSCTAYRAFSYHLHTLSAHMTTFCTGPQVRTGSSRHSPGSFLDSWSVTGISTLQIPPSNASIQHHLPRLCFSHPSLRLKLHQRLLRPHSHLLSIRRSSARRWHPRHLRHIRAQPKHAL